MLNNKPQCPEIKIQPAEKEHVEYILHILVPYMKVGKLLPRGKKDILENLYSNQPDTLNPSHSCKSKPDITDSKTSNTFGRHNFFIASFENEYVGCVAVRDYENGLYEIRSLAVSASFSGKGVGSALISFAIEIVNNERKGRKVFALTRRPNVFTSLGFEIVPMEIFPKKIWFDCSKCKKLDDCDEVAVLYYI
jgi:amino-acid N-acetyltransferase